VSAQDAHHHLEDAHQPSDGRARLIREAVRLEAVSIAWIAIEAIVAVASSAASGSLVLLAFGLDSVIELISAGVLMWRLVAELRRGAAFSESTERVATRIAGTLLLLLAAYITMAAGWSLWTRHGAEFSMPGFAVTLLAVPVMAHLARRKRSLADRLGSGGLRADAVESLACGWLAGVAVASLAAQATLGWWWIDAVGSLAIVWLLIREGLEPWRGESCETCD
jgi:divalent metal cation (Fe/Co/Zn/Cd) transporter